ncbi:MAG TPA: radical SAM family heme chaperone HemW [Bacteroidales bacterium]|nr:radical SAM family heme chaperone HemW [Bacteroidales bacterium]HPI68543.1 radical SAM family heme chaperone HemW [Bacteroidales bacterium]HPR72491.1 radical SAM family heme chaperone HemW [Bacteroidales bacterium]
MAGIYIHIPFCKKLCHYCDFYHVVSAGDHSEFISALGREAEERKSYITSEKYSTLYIGGGTPSVLSPKEIARILTDIDTHLGLGSVEEITIEVNPDDVTGSYMKDLKLMGINRVSIGIQSWNDDDLIMLNRRHTAAQAKEAIRIIFSSGFENVSADLIYGIPGMKTERWSENLDITFSTGINHLSAYHLSIEPGTVFWKMKEKGLLNETEEEESIQQFNILVDKTEEAGFIHYEISNFGKPGFFSVHNTNYWKQAPYIGLGPSAHSFNGYSRQWNLSDIEKYIKFIRSGRDYYEREELDLRTRFNEYVMTSLRTMWGIDLDFAEKTFEKEGYDYIMNTAGKFIDYGLMKKNKNTLVLSNQGKLISDNIISEFMMPSQGG